MNTELIIFFLIIFVIFCTVFSTVKESFEVNKNPYGVNKNPYEVNKKDPNVIKKKLGLDDYSVEKKRISYTDITAPRNSIRYFLDENRYNYVEDIPFSPHMILNSYDDIDVSSNFKIENKTDKIDQLNKILEQRYGEKADYCFRHKHKKECILSERNYKCFGKLEFTEKECEATTDLIGNRVNPGVWDRKCVNNEDCPFYKSNKNYPNEFGGCKADGYCDFPKGITRLSYRKYNKNSLPLCYNCKDKKTGKIGIDKCCYTQKQPDYVFDDDLQSRYKNKDILESRGLYTITHDNYDKEFRNLERKLKI